MLLQVVGEVLGHPLGEGRDEDALVLLFALADFIQEVVHLPRDGPDFHLRVHQSGRPNDLLDDNAPRQTQLILPRRGGDEHHARHQAHELVVAQRPVVEGGREPEPVVHERLFAGAVAFVHRAELRQRLVRLVDDAQIIVREIVEQAGGALARLAAAEMPRVVLDARAATDLQQHVDVEMRAGLQPLRLEQLVLVPQLGEPEPQLIADRFDRALDRRPLRDEVRGRVDRAALELDDHVASERIDLCDPLDRIAPEFDAHSLLVIRGEDLDRIPAHAERAPLEADIVALILDGYEIPEQRVPSPRLARVSRDQQLAIQLRVAQAVDRRNARHDHDVVTLHQTRCRTEPQPLDVVVDRRVLGDVRIGGRDVGLRLIVVVVRDEEFDCALREERLELPVELGRERLVVG